MDNNLNLTDKITTKDSIGGGSTLEHPSFSMQEPTFRTQIIGTNELGETVFEATNNTVIGGALFVLEKVFGVSAGLNVDYLNNFMGIATGGTPVTEKYPKDTVVCLFGVGTGGSGDSITSVKAVDFKERNVADIIPFRYTDTALSSADQEKYWFRKLDGNGRTAHYLKTFETQPVIKSLWKDAEGDEDGTEVTGDVHNSVRTEPIETFVELVLKINKNDCREWFEYNGNIEQARINTIGLFTGIKSQISTGVYDYKQVKLFAKLNINNEMLTAAKDLTITYRIYTS